MNIGTLTINQMTVTKVFTLKNQTIFDYENTTPNEYTDALRQTLRIGNLYINRSNHNINIYASINLTFLNVK